MASGPTIGSSALILTADDAQLQKGLTKAGQSVGKFRKEVEGHSAGIAASVEGGILGAFGKLTAIGAGLGGGVFAGLSLAGLVTDSVKLAASVEDTQTSFKVLLGDADEAAKLFKEIRDLAAATPLTSRDLADAAKSLLQVGVSADQIEPTLRALGDLASGSSEKLKELAVIYGQVKGKGKLATEELNQFAEHGVNLREDLARTLNVSMAELPGKLEEGAVQFRDLQGAIIGATSEGGRFFESMKEGSQTLTGKLSTLKDNWETLLANVGALIVDEFGLKGLVDSLAKLTEAGNDGVESWRPAFREIAGLARKIGEDLLAGGFTFAQEMAKAKDAIGEIRADYERIKGITLGTPAALGAARLGIVSQQGPNATTGVPAALGALGVAGGGMAAGPTEQWLIDLKKKIAQVLGKPPEGWAGLRGWGDIGAKIGDAAGKKMLQEIASATDADFKKVAAIRDEFDPVGKIDKELEALRGMLERGAFGDAFGEGGDLFHFAKDKLLLERRKLLEGPGIDFKPAGLAVADSREAAEAIIAQTVAKMGGVPQDKVLNKLEQQRKLQEDAAQKLGNIDRKLGKGPALGIF
jgi:tape measure domain-containing protein